MGLNQTYKLLPSKGNHKQNEKITNKLGEKKTYANNVTNKGLISNMYKQLRQVNIKKQTTQSKNVGRRSK